jgi:hypothetical protein
MLLRAAILANQNVTLAGDSCVDLPAATTQYDGVISGAGTFRPGLVFDRHQTDAVRLPLALIGKVYCKVDANYGRIEVGDLLSTSDTPGHAMKVGDPAKAFGTVIGKADSDGKYAVPEPGRKKSREY